jgi:ribosomal protein S12 methylthiotransferase
VHPKTKEARLNKLMKLEQKIAEIKLEEKIGNTYNSLVEDITPDSKYYIARSYMDIPDEDGVIFIENTKSIEIGTFVDCIITAVKDYDLIAKLK